MESSPLANGLAAPRLSEPAATLHPAVNGEEHRETKGRIHLKDLSSNPPADRQAEKTVHAAPAASGDNPARTGEPTSGAPQLPEAVAVESRRIPPADAPPSSGIGKQVAGTAEIVGRLRQLVAKTLYVEQSRIPEAKKLADLGLDSILAVELAKGISAEFKINLPAARLYDHPTIQHLANYVSQVLAQGPLEEVDSASIFFPTHLSPSVPSGPSGLVFVDGREQSTSDGSGFTRRIRSLVARTLFLEEGKIDGGKKFADLGLDSILAVELVKSLNSEFGVNLSAAALYSHATTRQLAAHIGELLRGKDSGQVFHPDRFFAPVLSHRESLESPVVPTVSSADPPSVRMNDHEAVKTPGGSKVRQVMVTWSGSIADLRFCHEVAAVPKAHEVQISVAAASVMLADLLCVRGLYPTMPPYPFTPGFEVAGTVVQVGGEVTDFRPGDRVCGLTGAQLGGHADLVNVDPRLLVRIPGALTFSDACTLPVSFLTARYALLDVGRLAPGETLLIHSAASCTGLMAIQLARRAGVKISRPSAPRRKLEYLRGLGLERVFNYRSSRHHGRTHGRVAGRDRSTSF